VAPETVACTPLANGFLFGRYKERPTSDNPEDNRGDRYQFPEEEFNACQKVIRRIEEYASKKSVTPTQISLAWSLVQKPYNIPVPDTRTPSHMQENLAAANV